jgi:uncharacterized protein YbjT (DUF2867 family)
LRRWREPSRNCGLRTLYDLVEDTAMKIAITGGTGFVGRHLARRLTSTGHEVVLIARGVDHRDEEVRRLEGVTFAPIGLDDAAALAQAFTGCDGIVHCAGINRELGDSTYQRVHVTGTRNVVGAAERAGVRRIVLLSFLRARPACGSAYHESKWAAEEIVRASGLDYTVVKSGMIYGKGDHMLDHISHTVHTVPLFAWVGLREQPIRPVAIEDVVRIIEAALAEGRLVRQTVAVVGPDEMTLSGAVQRVAGIVGKRVVVFPMPVFFHRLLARAFEHTMTVPLIALAQVRMLAEGITSALPACDLPPDSLLPRTHFTEQHIRKHLPDAEPFGRSDLRCFATSR